MNLERLQLEYVGSRRGFGAVTAAVVGVAAMAFALHEGVRYRELQSEIEAKEVRLAAALAERKARPQPGEQLNTEQYAFARDTIRRLSMPWDRLFGALEAAQIDQVALISLEPDAESRSVSVAGEAKDYLAALSYVANLSEQRNLTGVHLMRHELRKAALPRPVAFTISAAWPDRP